MTEKELLKKLNSAAEEIMKSNAINERDKLHPQHIAEISRQLKECSEVDVKNVGIWWIPKNSMTIEVSPSLLEVQNKSSDIKIKAVFSYAEELIKELNERSSFVKFRFSGHYFIGRFIRNGKCIIKVNWRTH